MFLSDWFAAYWEMVKQNAMMTDYPEGMYMPYTYLPNDAEDNAVETQHHESSTELAEHPAI